MLCVVIMKCSDNKVSSSLLDLHVYVCSPKTVSNLGIEEASTRFFI